MIGSGTLPGMPGQWSSSDPEAADELPTDLRFLVTAAPEEVEAVLEPAVGARAHLAAVYRTSADFHRGASDAVRRQVLALDAARLGDSELAARIVAARLDAHPAAQWGPIWATGSGLADALPHARASHSAEVRAVAVTADGRYLVSADSGGEVQLHDLATGQRIGGPVHDGGGVGQVAVVVIDDRPLVITGSGEEGTVRMWDPVTGRRTGEVLTDAGYAPALATATLDGRPVVIAGCLDDTVRLWDPTTGQALGSPLVEECRLLSAAAASFHDRTVAVTVTDPDGDNDYGTVHVWEAGTGRRIGVPFGDGCEVSLAAVASVGERLVVVTKGWDHTVRIWDPLTGRQTGAPVADDVRAHALVTSTVHGRAVAACGEWWDGHGRVRVWDLETGRQTGPALVFPARIATLAATVSGSLAVGFGSDIAVLDPR
ncbi:hypothetical protein HS045_09110 [Planomonospora sp. ID82291]|nr:hypothetical protein [Planomonospora sp. ID82291]